MVLESLNSDRVNIGRLVLEDPSPSSPNNLSYLEMIKTEDFTRINSSINRLRVRKSWLGFVNTLSAYQIAFPEEASRIKISDKVWQDIEGVIFRDTVETEVLANLKLSYSGRFRNLVGAHQDSFKDAGDNLYRHIGGLRGFPLRDTLNNLFIMKILYPTQRLDEHLNNFWPRLMQDLVALPDRNWVTKAGKLRVLRPDVIQKFSLTDAHWSSFAETLDFFKKTKDWRTLVEMMYSLRVLKAEDVQITNEGLKLVFPQTPKPFLVEPSPLPTVRNF